MAKAKKDIEMAENGKKQALDLAIAQISKQFRVLEFRYCTWWWLSKRANY